MVGTPQGLARFFDMVHLLVVVLSAHFQLDQDVAQITFHSVWVTQGYFNLV